MPWKPSVEDDEGETVMPNLDMPMREPDVEIKRPEVREEEVMPRRLYIKGNDVERFGASERCKGCVAVLRGNAGVAHTEACRKRLTEEILKSEGGRARVEAAGRRGEEYKNKTRWSRTTRENEDGRRRGQKSRRRIWRRRREKRRMGRTRGEAEAEKGRRGRTRLGRGEREWRRSRRDGRARR